MRKILLASVATVAMTGVAAASGLEPTLGSSSSSIINKAEPGKAVVRLDGYVFFGAGVGNNTVDTAPNGAKADSFGFMSTFRIYPAFDAQTPGGLRYGAFAEVRTNSNSGGASGGVGTSSNRTTNTMYVNRAFGYVGTDQIGTIRFGSIDGPASMMRTGTFEGKIGDGGWNGNAPGLTKGVNPFRFAVGGSYEYASQKVTWMSPTWGAPTWGAVQLGASFAPSSASTMSGDGNQVGIGGNTRQAASTLAGDLGRARNTFQIGARYTGNFGAVGTQVHVGYIGSSAIKNANVGGVTRRGLSIVTAGATVSYMGFMVGGYMNTGAFNGNFSPVNPGDSNSTVYTLGASYNNGPWTVGAAYLNAKFAGLSGNNVNRTDQGWAAGAVYNYAPGARVFLEFVTGTARERGVDLTTALAGTTKEISSTALILGNSFRW